MRSEWIPAPHPMFRGNPDRTGRSTSRIPRSRPKIAWQFRTERPIYSSPALDRQGNLYVGSLDGHLYSLTSTGALRWKTRLGGQIFSSPAITSRGIVAGSDNDHVYLLDQGSGAQIWSYQLGPCPAAPGLGPDSVRCDANSSVLVGAAESLIFGGDALYSLTLEGKLGWRVELVDHAASSPSVGADGTYYIGTQANRVLAVTAAGVKKWEFRSRGDCDTSPVLADPTTVVVGCDDGKVYALAADTGEEKWVFVAHRAVRSSPAVSPGGSILFGTDRGRLHAVGLDGKQKWFYETGGPVRSSPTVDPDGTVVFGSQDNHVYSLAASGALLWKMELGGDVDSSVTVGPDGALYVGADDNHLYALR